jgi:hypothetical protein
VDLDHWKVAAEMKGLFCAGLLLALQSLTASHAYEADIHYSTTYALARASGWSAADALTIASANEGVDENEGTVAALEVDATGARSLHQAEKNLSLHCFGETHGEAGQISADVLQIISRHFAEVPAPAEDPRSHAARLIALGVALHCQQDAYSHVDFGGSCGSYLGSCYGHSYETFLDQAIFALLKKHYYNPDHPGVSGQRLQEALQGTASELAVRRPKASSRSIAAHELIALSDALRESGLELPDDVRRECNRYVAGRWLFAFLHSGGRKPGNADVLERLAPEVAMTCRNASLASASIVRIPEPRFPRLNADASPYLVRADGTYQQIPGGISNGSSPNMVAAGAADRPPNYKTRTSRMQWSHWSQLLAVPRAKQVALLSPDSKAR